jgi:hypothetical protein
MSTANNNVLNTLYSQYRTPEAISRAANSDFIPLDGNLGISAVHPIPVEWLREELLPRQRDRVRKHVAAQLSGTRSLVPAYVEALQATISNLNMTPNASSDVQGPPPQ